VGIQAKTGKCKLGHIRASHDDCTRRLKTLYDYRIRLGGFALSKHFRAGSRNFTRYIKEVFY